MSESPIQIPERGKPIMASWGADVANLLNACASDLDAMRSQGAPPSSSRENDRQPHPFEVRGVTGSGGSESPFVIHLPPGSLTIDGEAVSINGATSLEDGRYSIDQEAISNVSTEPHTLYLVVHNEDEDGESADGAPASDDGSSDDGSGYIADLTDNPDGIDGDVLAKLPVADIFTMTCGDMTCGCVSAQHLTCAVALSSRGAEPDGVSIDSNGGGENWGDPGTKLEIAHFHDFERDSGKGLSKRLKADTSTGDLSPTESDDEIMFVCRKHDGSILYVPLGGDGEDPEDEDDARDDDCAHPGGGIGVDAPQDDAWPGNDHDDGGVPAEGPGSDDPWTDCCGD